MATMKKAPMKKSAAPKKMSKAAPAMQAPPQMGAGGPPMMKKGGKIKIKKAQSGAELNKRYDAAYKKAQADSTDYSNTKNETAFKFLKGRRSANTPVTDDELKKLKSVSDQYEVRANPYSPLNAKRHAANTMKTGGKIANGPVGKKFAALAAPKNKITFADKIAGAKKVVKAVKKAKKK